VWALSQLRAALDQGFILTPRRFQPIPHESDVIGMRDGEHDKFVMCPPLVTLLQSLIWRRPMRAAMNTKEHTSQERMIFRIAAPFWWQCGFLATVVRLTHHTRLEPYSLVRFQSGTGNVSLAATAHGRRCFPQRNSACTPPGDWSLSPAHN
jgi:hypothetical protein